jgi:hypothetical protein
MYGGKWRQVFDWAPLLDLVDIIVQRLPKVWELGDGVLRRNTATVEPKQTRPTSSCL